MHPCSEVEGLEDVVLAWPEVVLPSTELELEEEVETQCPERDGPRSASCIKPVAIPIPAAV